MFHASCFMLIGIDASRAFIKNRTGIEEYSYQVIKHLVPPLRDDQVILYARNMKHGTCNMFVSNLPKNWKIKVIRWPYLWTQVGLSLEMLFHPVDVLFIPAHTVPIIHPKNTFVTIHGLEYEFCPKAYSWWERFYMRCVIKNSCKWAKTIISVSNNTKNDLIKLYRIPEEKIRVIYEGYDRNFQFPRLPKSGTGGQAISNFPATAGSRQGGDQTNSKFQIPNSKFLLFISRLEERKNIVGIIKSFEILKEQYKVPHKLILAGKFGYGKDKILEELKGNNFANDIIIPGYISEEEKWNLLKNADVFLFPTFYEGFGIPILEAQSVGTPVVAGNNSSIKEVITFSFSPQTRRDAPEGQRGDENSKQDLPLTPSLLRRERIESALLVDSNNAEKIADTAYKLISDKNLRDDIIKRGYENVKRFSWERCAEQIAEIMDLWK